MIWQKKDLNTPVRQRAFGQVSASIMSDISDNSAVGFPVNNLLVQTTRLEVGGTTYHPGHQWAEGKGKVSLLLRASW